MTGGGSSLPEVQRLLAVLAAGRKCAEIGTAYGEGAAAIAATAASLLTVEIDADRAEIAAERLTGLDNVELIVGDWRDALPPRAPFDFLFFDAGHLDRTPEAIDLIGPGGLLLKDDLTPGRPGPDPVRDLLFGDARLQAVEILTTPSTAVVIAARHG